MTYMADSENGYKTTKERITAFAKGLIMSGVSRRTAVAIVALSQGESGYRPNGPRPLILMGAGASPTGQTPSCLGLTVGLEVGKFDKVLSNNPKATAWFLKHGWLATDQGKMKPSGGLGVAFPNSTNKIAFEYTIANKMADLLVIWSLGPTQIYSGGSAGGMTKTNTIAGAKAFYLSQTYEDLRSNGQNYLVPKSEGGWLNDKIKPPLAGGSASDARPWLTVQAGNSALADELFAGGPHFPGRRPFEEVISEVNAIVAP